MTFSFKPIRRANPEKYAPAHFLPPPISHGHAYPRRQMYRVAGMAFNFSAIEVPPVVPLRAQKQKRPEQYNTGSNASCILNMPGILPGF